LDHALKLIATASYSGQVLFGQLTPPLLDPALHLLPISFNARPIHANLLYFQDFGTHPSARMAAMLLQTSWENPMTAKACYVCGLNGFPRSKA